MPAKSWMPLWLAMVCAVVAWSATTLLRLSIITQCCEDNLYVFSLDVMMFIITAMPIFWLLSYVRHNQLAYIKRLPLLLLLVWSLPILAVLYHAAKSDPLYDTILFGCITIWILAGLIEATRTGFFDRIRHKATPLTREARQAARQAARKQAEQDAANPAYVRKSERAEGFFEVVGGTKPNGTPHQIYYTPDPDKAERIATERRNKGGL